MNKILAVVALLAVGAARADAFDFVSGSQALTGTAPTLSTQGIPLVRMARVAKGYRVLTSAQAAATITGGTLRCYYYSPVSTRWARCPTFDVTLTTGRRDAMSIDFQPLVGFGRLYYVTDTVTVSAGTTVAVTIEVSYASP